MNQMDNTCIFCKLVSGNLPTTTVFEDDFLKAIMDISPANKGHVIIIPKTHATDIFNLEDDFVSKAFLLAKKLAITIQDVTGCDGVNILQNNGVAAGQTVFHFHIHIVPRFKEDDITIAWKQQPYKDGEADNIAKKIAEKLQ